MCIPWSAPPRHDSYNFGQNKKRNDPPPPPAPQINDEFGLKPKRTFFSIIELGEGVVLIFLLNCPRLLLVTEVHSFRKRKSVEPLVPVWIWEHPLWKSFPSATWTMVINLGSVCQNRLLEMIGEQGSRSGESARHQCVPVSIPGLGGKRRLSWFSGFSGFLLSSKIQHTGYHYHLILHSFFFIRTIFIRTLRLRFAEILRTC